MAARDFMIFRFGERRQVIGLVLGPVLFLLTGLILQSRGLTSEASWAAATVALMSCWWITEPVPLWATACVPVVTFPLLNQPLSEIYGRHSFGASPQQNRQ